MWKDAKYLLAYMLPITTGMGIWLGGAASFAGLGLSFLVLPMLEFVLKPNVVNIPESQELSRSKKLFFDALLYLNVPIVYSLVAFLLIRISAGVLQPWEIAGMILSVGVVIGTCGINVGHELGHRDGWFDQLCSRLLLASALYTHFTVEHNYGHHKHVATPQDPATAHFGEIVFAFWGRSIRGTFTNAWKLQRSMLSAEGKSFWNLRRNILIQGVILQILYLASAWAFGGLWAVGVVCATALMGVLLLETVNYVEHYGLRRQKLASGRYEPVNPSHSWNSDHELGRIFLYELTRHSDHHFKSTRKYQVLRHLDESPQLPYGYPASVVMALIPPLWMSVMNERIRQFRPSES